jgi:hypothetical protein
MRAPKARPLFFIFLFFNIGFGKTPNDYYTFLRAPKARFCLYLFLNIGLEKIPNDYYTYLRAPKARISVLFISIKPTIFLLSTNQTAPLRGQFNICLT